MYSIINKKLPARDKTHSMENSEPPGSSALSHDSFSPAHWSMKCGVCLSLGNYKIEENPPGLPPDSASPQDIYLILLDDKLS